MPALIPEDAITGSTAIATKAMPADTEPVGNVKTPPAPDVHDAATEHASPDTASAQEAALKLHATPVVHPTVEGESATIKSNVELGPESTASRAEDAQASAEATAEDTLPAAASQEIPKIEEHPAAEKSGEAMSIVAGMGPIPVETAGGAKAVPDTSPIKGLAAVESVVEDATGVTEKVGSIVEHPSARAVPAAESDALSTASTDDAKVERDFDEATARAKKELNLIQKMFKKIFKKKSKRKRSSKKKAAASREKAQAAAAAAAKKDDGGDVGARARGEEGFLVRIAKEAEAEVGTAAAKGGGGASSNCDERKPAADDRSAVEETVGASAAVMNQATIMEVGAMDTE